MPLKKEKWRSFVKVKSLWKGDLGRGGGTAPLSQSIFAVSLKNSFTQNTKNRDRVVL
jgi:hypothetical protein